MSLNQFLYNGPSNSTSNNRNWLDVVVNSIRLGNNSSSELTSYHIDAAPVSGSFSATNVNSPACNFRLEAIGKTAVLKVGDLQNLVVSVASADVTSSYTIASAYRPSQDTACIIACNKGTAFELLKCIVKTNGKININAEVGSDILSAATYSFPEAFCLTWKF